MGLLRRVATVSGWTFVSRMLGLLRDRVLGATFGASLLLDAFMLAFALPNLLRNLFGEGALAAAYVPRYVHARGEDVSAAEAFAGLVLTRLGLLLSLIAVIGMAVACGMVVWGGPRWVLVAALVIPQVPYLVFICLAAVMAGTLHGRQHFWIPAAAPIVLNVCLLLAVWWWADIWMLPFAVLVAGLVQMAVHVLGLACSGGVPPLLLRSSARLRDLRQAWLPTMAAASVHQVNALLDSLIAFVLLAHRPGAVTVLYFANRLLQFPMALVAHGVSTAIYPDLSRAAKEGWPQAGIVLRRGTRVLAAALFPAAAGLWVVADPLVRTVFQTGAFAAEDAQRTILLTQFYALALLPLSFHKLLIRALHAGLDQRTPLRIALISVSVNLVLNIILVQTPLYEAGLALATVISGTLACALAAIVLLRRGSGAILDYTAVLRPAIATLGMATAAYLVLAWYDVPSDAGTAQHALRLIMGVGTGVAAYAAIMGRAGAAALGR
ncbi:MAG: murein biosynthesis integral membrane protein MurJ [Planctomycetota bacterium]|nr:MAG: murein biosynthesis integral membrane protein MurJ [Planctomycetota bacterium]